MTTPASKKCTRRDVLRSAAVATGLAALPDWFLETCSSQVFARENSPNERPKVALIGCGGMGAGDAKNAERFGDIVAVCDVDKGRVEDVRKIFKNAKGYRDYRDVCDQPNIDVIINA